MDEQQRLDEEKNTDAEDVETSLPAQEEQPEATEATAEVVLAEEAVDSGEDGDALDSAEPAAFAFDALEEDTPEEPVVDIRAALREARASIASVESPVVEDAPEAAAPVQASDDRAWFVIHCYSGYEKKVKHNLEQRIETMGMADQIFQVVVPTEEEIEVKEGKRRTVERRVFPGYILVQMKMNDDSWYVVRNTPGVTGFVGMGNKPTPLRAEEVQNILKRMEAEAPKVKVTFKPGQKVRIIDGPFNDFLGIVDEIDMDKAKARVMVSFFGRDTPVELDFLQVEKV
jgi:transcriptional antiterminator NusG